ncbi:MAG: tripartite tricarboxylate transporter substrate binding protein [Pseudorhodoplanes sp.]|nr:tripartite tricarboxylate transporter substrate binding protein [Pseudorhodoplanes sp.]
MRNRREFIVSTAGLAVAAAIIGTNASTALAQDWPQRPVTIIVPFAAGGNTDGIARITAQRLTETLGGQFVVENRPGAGGALAAETVAKSPPDGYTLLIAALPVMAIVPAINKVRYDAQKNFTPITNIATNPFVLVVNKDVPVKTLKEFIAYVKARDGQLTYGSAGIGSLNHLSMALFLKKAGIEMTHVPYKGNAPALSDVVAGHVPAMFSNFSDALPQANAGHVRMLALSSKERSPLAKDLPTVAESGFPDFNILTWNGLMAPSDTPKPIVDKIAGVVAAAIKDPKFSARLSEFGVDPLGSSPEEYRTMLAKDVATWADVVNIAGVTR